MSHRVDLTPHEVALAIFVGLLRQGIAEGRGSRDTGRAFGTLTGHALGAAGEIAVARFLNRYWDGSFNTFKRGDVGPYQVRTRSYLNAEMIVRDGDHDDDTFVLVVLDSAPTLYIVGWMLARDAKQPGWFSERGAEKGDRPCYWVPQSALHPMETLPPL